MQSRLSDIGHSLKSDSTCGQSKGKEPYLYFFLETAFFSQTQQKTGREKKSLVLYGNIGYVAGQHRALRRVPFPGWDHTQPVGLGRPAILQAPLPGPEGKSSYTSFSL